MTEQTKTDLSKVHEILDQRIFEFNMSDPSAIEKVTMLESIALRVLRACVGVLK